MPDFWIMRRSKFFYRRWEEGIFLFTDYCWNILLRWSEKCNTRRGARSVHWCQLKVKPPHPQPLSHQGRREQERSGVPNVISEASLCNNFPYFTTFILSFLPPFKAGSFQNRCGLLSVSASHLGKSSQIHTRSDHFFDCQT